MSVIIVCGSRDWDDRDLLLSVLHGVYRDGDVIRHGAARGADQMAEDICQSLGIETDPMPADWDTHGRNAGPIRNAAMRAKLPQPRLVVAFMSGKQWSPGTANMIKQAEGDIPIILVQKR